MEKGFLHPYILCTRFIIAQIWNESVSYKMIGIRNYTSAVHINSTNPLIHIMQGTTTHHKKI